MGFSAIPLQLLITLRWIAVTGQFVTIFIVYFGFGFKLPFPSLLLIIFFSILVNIAFGYIRPKSNFILHPQVSAYLFYDLGQLSAILYLTGGLNNPFSVLLLAPVVIAAGFLPQKKSLLLYGGSLGCLFLLALSPYPLPWNDQGLELPLLLKTGIGSALAIAITFMAFYVARVAQEGRRLDTALGVQTLSLAREQRLASLGGLAAAAAHELGTPLTTISLIVQELLEEKGTLLSSQQADLALIKEQLKRCRHILEELAKNFVEEKKLPFERLPPQAALKFIAARLPPNPHKIVHIQLSSGGPEPLLILTPELIHSLNNILQNGWQFATSLLLVDLSWNEKNITIIVKDDGPGYPSAIFDRLGEPYVSGRPLQETHYHLGLGIFIAQALLEKEGGTLYFNNDQGARCTIQLPHHLAKER